MIERAKFLEKIFSSFCLFSTRRIIEMIKNFVFVLQVRIGDLSLYDQSQCSNTLDIIIIAVSIAVPVIVVLIVLIIVLVWWQRKKGKQQEEQNKMILSKLDDLENKTRETARNGTILLFIKFFIVLYETA